MGQSPLKIINGRIITPSRIIQSGCLLVEGDGIIGISDRDIEARDAQLIDARGNYIAPGFIDIHVHGGGGCDFMDGTVAAFLAVAALHARHGVTSMLPTSLTSDKKNILHTLSAYEEADKQNSRGARFIGMHLEGPYFAMSQRGAQDPRYIRDPDPAEYREILAATSAIKRWSAAPERKGAIEFGRELRDRGILPSIAHTDAIYEVAKEAFDSGYTHATHLYSCMSSVTRRDGFRYAGVIEAAYLIDEMTVEIIADGVHLPAPLLQLVCKIKGPDKIALVTDAMRAAGMPPGESILGSLEDGLKVIVEDDVAKLPDRTAFAGSVATADRLVRNMVNMADVPLTDAVKMMTSTPAAIMGLSGKIGSLEAGKDADIVIFDENISVEATVVKGNVVYKRDEHKTHD